MPSFNRIFRIGAMLFLISAFSAYAQKTDSLYKVYRTKDAADTSRWNAIYALTQNYQYSNSDSCFILASEGLKLARERKNQKWEADFQNMLGIAYEGLGKNDLARENYLASLKKAEVIGYEDGIAMACGNLGNQAYSLSDFKNAMIYHERCLKIREKIGPKKLLAGSYNNIGLLYEEMYNYPLALEYYFRSLKIKEELGNKRGMANTLGNIGAVYHNIGDVKKTLEYQGKSLALRREIKDRKGESLALGNMGITYEVLGDHEKALAYQLESLKIKEELNDRKNIGYTLGNIGNIYESLKQYDKALDYQFKSLAVKEEFGDKQGVNVAIGNIGKIYLMKKDYRKATEYSERSYAMAKESGDLSTQSSTANCLYSIYKETGDTKKSLDYFEQFVVIKDSILREESNKEITRKELQYQFAKKTSADSIRNIEEKKVIAVQLKQEKTQRYALYGGIGLLLVFASLMFNRFKVTQRQKKIIELKNEETEIQKGIIEQKQHEILDSINYAKRIQYALLAHEDLLKENLKEHFVFFQPKDIVSGDFYWATCADASAAKATTVDSELRVRSLESSYSEPATNNSELFFLAVCDSTGHGVPGAFMSLLNISFLNEAINEKKLVRPNEILNHVRLRLIESISKEGGKDGMDAILICMPLADATMEKKITYAAANNSLVIVRNGELLQGDTDKMPVGKGERSESFSLKTISVQSGDMIYLYTDGYADQFGGPKGKKFMYKRLNKLLLSITDRSMPEQHFVLEKTINEWKGEAEQVDDICIIGIRM
jgi:tetratricopeptide (TPR) repeat protein